MDGCTNDERPRRSITAAARVRRALRRISRCLHLTVSVVAFVCLSRSGVVAQSNAPAELPARWHFSYEMFQMLLEQRGLTMTDGMDSALNTPDESVIVLLGDQRRVSRQQWLRLRRYVAQGGSLLIASEDGLLLPGVCSFVAGPVTSRLNQVQYQSFPDCLSLPVTAEGQDLLNGVSEIVVNRCGWLTPPTDDSLAWTALAVLPNGCEPTAAGGNAAMMYGLDAESERGVMLLSADQSLFSNGMLWHGDNAIFAVRAADVLCGDGRSRLFIMSNGNILPGYRDSAALQPPQQPRQPNVPPRVPPIQPPIPEPDLATMLKIANRAIDKVQESNLLNEALRDRPRNMRPLAWLRTVLLALLLACMALVAWRLFRRRTQLPPLRESRFMQSMFGAATARQVQSNEFSSAVEILARSLCRDLSGSAIEADWQKMIASDQPLLHRLSRRQQAGFRGLVAIAVNGCREHFSRKKFQEFGRLVHELQVLSVVSGPDTANAAPSGRPVVVAIGESL